VIVVDTNVTAYLWLRGELTPAAEQVLRKDPDWAVPVSWRSEFRTVLAGSVTRRLCTLDDAVAIAGAAEDLVAGREFAVDSGDVLRLADDSGCSSYDCEFVVLARRLGVRLVTNDRDVLKSFPGLAVSLEAYRD
jgi:predicted nucleic acid-binding protein